MSINAPNCWPHFFFIMQSHLTFNWFILRHEMEGWTMPPFTFAFSEPSFRRMPCRMGTWKWRRGRCGGSSSWTSTSQGPWTTTSSGSASRRGGCLRFTSRPRSGRSSRTGRTSSAPSSHSRSMPEPCGKIGWIAWLDHQLLKNEWWTVPGTHRIWAASRLRLLWIVCIFNGPFFCLPERRKTCANWSIKHTWS